jgi:hypothetical protein
MKNRLPGRVTSGTVAPYFHIIIDAFVSNPIARRQYMDFSFPATGCGAKLRTENMPEANSWPPACPKLCIGGDMCEIKLILGATLFALYGIWVVLGIVCCCRFRHIAAFLPCGKGLWTLSIIANNAFIFSRFFYTLILRVGFGDADSWLFEWSGMDFQKYFIFNKQGKSKTSIFIRTCLLYFRAYN